MIERRRPGAQAVELFLAAVLTRLRTEIARTPAARPARPLFEAGGKRLRARLLWWSATATSPTPLDPANERLARAATAIELAHLGSLIHDDMVDGGETRRGVPTLHRQCGVRVATDTGAALAHLASELIVPLGRPARRAVRRAILATCRGQIRELAVPFVRLPPRTRVVIMQEKTGAFFELAAALGSLVAGAPRSSRAAVCRFARRFGVAFQIADDVLDLAGDPAVLGRANGADLRDGVLTLPILLAGDPAGSLADALQRLRVSADTRTLAECAELVHRRGGVETAAAVAQWWLDNAIHALATIPNAGTTELRALAQTSVARGLRRGSPRFSTAPPDRHTNPPPLHRTIDSPGAGWRAPEDVLGARLTSLLDWFHPGLAEAVSARAGHPSVRPRRARLRRRLLRDDAWSSDARVAADAIALACSLADDRALRTEPARTLALVDALHCAAIALLNDEAAPREQQEMAARARELGAPRSPIEPFVPAAIRSALVPASAPSNA